MLVLSEKASAHRQVLLSLVPKKSTPGEPPHGRMCIDFRKLNDLQPKVCCADSQTGGNISLVPLPKIDEMYGRLNGAKYFTTLDL